MLRKAALIVLFVSLLVPCMVCARGMQLVEDEELAAIRGAFGLAASYYFTLVLGETGLTPEQIMEKWNALTPEEKAAAKSAVLAKLSSMTDEEKAALCKQQMESMSPPEMGKLSKNNNGDVTPPSADEMAQDRAFTEDLRKALGQTGLSVGGTDVTGSMSSGAMAPMGGFGMKPQAMP